MLLALLLVLTELSYRNEMPAIWSAGVSPFRIDGSCFCLSRFPLAACTFFINDQAVPRAAPTLREWGIGDYGEKKLKVGGERDPIWMRAGRDILRAGSANAQATELEDVIIFRRDENGLLREQIIAKNAVLTEDRWQLSNVIVYYRDNLPPEPTRQTGLFRLLPARCGRRPLRRSGRDDAWATSAISSRIPASASGPPGSIRPGGTSG